MVWLILGILIGAGVFWVFTEVKAGKKVVKWYQWLLGFATVVMFLLTVQNYLGFQRELEPAAANFVLLAMGLPTIILAVLVWCSPKILNKLSKTNIKSNSEKAVS